MSFMLCLRENFFSLVNQPLSSADVFISTREICLKKKDKVLKHFLVRAKNKVYVCFFFKLFSE
jgi:hypothetical protein